jgi:hypothetical protein
VVPAAPVEEPPTIGLASSGGPAALPTDSSEEAPAPVGLAQSGATPTVVTRPTVAPPVDPPGPRPVAPTPFTPTAVPDIETDVDAGSDVPARPPQQADDGTDEIRE